MRVAQGQLEAPATAPEPANKPVEAAHAAIVGQPTVEAMEKAATTARTVGPTARTEAAGTETAPMDAESTPGQQAEAGNLSEGPDAPGAAETAPAKTEAQQPQQERSGGGGGYGSFQPRPEVLRGVLMTGGLCYVNVA